MFSEKFHKAAGFSLVELMVVVTVISGLAVIGMPRFRTMVARARQAEAKTTLEQIHKLNTLHQTAKDKFARWSKGNSIGYQGATNRACGATRGSMLTGNGSCTGCTTPADCNGLMTKSVCEGKTGPSVWKSEQPGAKSLGFKLSSCNEARYQYWINYEVINGREYYHAFAYSPSDPDGRIFPTCNGTKGSRAPDIPHHKAHANLAATGGSVTFAGGDLQGVDEDKSFSHDDIVPACE